MPRRGLPPLFGAPWERNEPEGDGQDLYKEAYNQGLISEEEYRDRAVPLDVLRSVLRSRETVHPHALAALKEIYERLTALENKLGDEYKTEAIIWVLDRISQAKVEVALAAERMEPS